MEEVKRLDPELLRRLREFVGVTNGNLDSCNMATLAFLYIYLSLFGSGWDSTNVLLSYLFIFIQLVSQDGSKNHVTHYRYFWHKRKIREKAQQISSNWDSLFWWFSPRKSLMFCTNLGFQGSTNSRKAQIWCLMERSWIVFLLVFHHVLCMIA